MAGRAAFFFCLGASASVCLFVFVCVGKVEILTCDGSAGAGSSNSL